MRKINKKGMMAIDYILLLLLGLLAVSVILLAVYKAKLVDYFRKLPVDEPVPEKDIVVDATDPAVRSACPYIIAKIRWGKEKEIQSILFCPDYNVANNFCLDSGLIVSDLYWRGNKDDAVIMVDEFGFDRIIGEVKSGVVSLDKSKIPDIGSTYIYGLDGGFYFYGNWICKLEAIATAKPRLDWKDDISSFFFWYDNIDFNKFFAEHPNLEGITPTELAQSQIALFKIEDKQVTLIGDPQKVKNIYYLDNTYSGIYVYDGNIYIDKSRNEKIGYIRDPTTTELGKFFITAYPNTLSDFQKTFLEKLSSAEYIGYRIYSIGGASSY